MRVPHAEGGLGFWQTNGSWRGLLMADEVHLLCAPHRPGRDAPRPATRLAGNLPRFVPPGKEVDEAAPGPTERTEGGLEGHVGDRPHDAADPRPGVRARALLGVSCPKTCRGVSDE